MTRAGTVGEVLESIKTADLSILQRCPKLLHSQVQGLRGGMAAQELSQHPHNH